MKCKRIQSKSKILQENHGILRQCLWNGGTVKVVNFPGSKISIGHLLQRIMKEAPGHIQGRPKETAPRVPTAFGHASLARTYDLHRQGACLREARTRARSVFQSCFAPNRSGLFCWFRPRFVALISYGFWHLGRPEPGHVFCNDLHYVESCGLIENRWTIYKTCRIMWNAKRIQSKYVPLLKVHYCPDTLF